jgi:hypothetical protein
MNLWMFYIGGDCGNSNIELHDIRFSMGETAEDCYEDLRRQWWGTPKTLHIDSWGKIEQADGYDIALSETPFSGPETLFFLNLGGYRSEEFEEVHKNILVVAETKHKAIHKGLTGIRHWNLPHRDAIFEVEKVISVSQILQEKGLHLHLTPAALVKPFVWKSKYLRINQE